MTVVWNWGKAEKDAFAKMKHLLTSPPILQQVKEDERFYNHTDGSNYALGAVLMQGKKEKQHPIEYASRLLLKAEQKMKHLLTSPPILQQVKEDERFYINTDASNYVLGPVLMQGQKEKQHPIEYASRLLLKAEQNYSTTEREALAVVWAVQKFCGNIEGADITILTDHQPLKWLFTLKSQED